MKDPMLNPCFYRYVILRDGSSIRDGPSSAPQVDYWLSHICWISQKGIFDTSSSPQREVSWRFRPSKRQSADEENSCWGTQRLDFASFETQNLQFCQQTDCNLELVKLPMKLNRKDIWTHSVLIPVNSWPSSGFFPTTSKWDHLACSTCLVKWTVTCCQNRLFGYVDPIWLLLQPYIIYLQNLLDRNPEGSQNSWTLSNGFYISSTLGLSHKPFFCWGSPVTMSWESSFFSPR